MPKHKTLIVFAVVIAFSFSLFGCGLLTSRTAGPEDVTVSGDDLPEWLLLAHRSAEGPGTERDDDLLEIADDENDTDSDLAVGGSDQDDNVTVPSSSQGTQTAQAPQSTQPSSTEGGGTSGDSADSDEEPAFGTKEHLIWLKEQQDNAKTVGEREAAKAAEEAAEDDSGWWNNPTSGSGGSFFGN